MRIVEATAGEAQGLGWGVGRMRTLGTVLASVQRKPHGVDG